ncbi:hypothetical protein HCN44_002820 [Aphidius gifuensis]|uniref:F-box domain-containing protein n=1 Tax=Aphidius gifuensis TaxID=684658 RepID=A0A834XPV4_APHGI|nr:hypothetical protein HCN44_002820 [Aphidius gifuensis]
MGITSSTQMINQQVFYDKINDLNDDCLAEIFMKLSLEERLIIESVCQRWKNISQISWYNVEKMNLQNLGLDKNYISQDDDTMLRYFFKSIHLFERCGKFVKILDLTWVHDSSIMPIIKLHFPFIKKLKLQINDWINRDFDNAFSNMKNLESLSIVIEPNNQSIPLTLIDALNGVVDKLKKLKFKNYLYCTKPCGSEEMTIPNQLASIIKQSKSLNCLSLVGYELSDAIIAEISNKKSLTNLVIHKRLKCNNDKSIYPISQYNNYY